MDKPKQYPTSAAVGAAGLALCARIVSEMGHIWRSKPEGDVGIDGEIELVLPRTHAATGQVIWVQSKARTDPFLREDDRSFTFRCDRKDIDYWLGCDLPVVLVCSHPAGQEAWFKVVTAWFADPARRSNGEVEFDKTLDAFDETAASALMKLSPPKVGTVVRPVATPEVLRSNLLPLSRTPDKVWSSSSSVRGWSDINARFVQAGYEPADDLAWRDGRIYSFRPFDVPPLDCLGDGGQERLAFDELADSESDDDQRLLVRVFNGTLREAHKQDLAWSRTNQYLYFRASEDLSERSIRRSPKSPPRSVFKGYTKKADPTQVSHYRHSALRYQFVRLDTGWACVLTPTYHYTIDGHRPSKFGGDLTKRIKQIERHEAVRQQVVFWASYLTPPAQLFSREDQPLEFGTLISLGVDRGIDDEDWAARPASDESESDQYALSLEAG